VLRVVESHRHKLDAPALSNDVYEGRRFVDPRRSREPSGRKPPDAVYTPIDQASRARVPFA
jgi:hypothetical protein